MDMTVKEFHAAVGAGDRLTIVNRFGQEATGRVVMRNDYGFVLNMGGAHGTPAVATPANTVKIRKATARVAATAALLR
jgi:hypothetical protein